MPNFFDKEKYVIHYESLKLYWRLGLKQKKNTSRVKIQSISMAKRICLIQLTKIIKAEENGDKDGKAL